MASRPHTLDRCGTSDLGPECRSPDVTGTGDSEKHRVSVYRAANLAGGAENHLCAPDLPVRSASPDRTLSAATNGAPRAAAGRMTERFALLANGVALAYEVIGAPSRPVVMPILG